MTHDEVTAAMKAEDVDAALVEKAAKAQYAADPYIHLDDGPIGWEWLDDPDRQELLRGARHALAAVLPEIQARAQQDLIADLLTRHLWPVRHDLNEYPIEAVPKSALLERRNRLARLAAAIEEPNDQPKPAKDGES